MGKTERGASAVAGILALALFAPDARAHGYAGSMDAETPRPAAPAGEGADAERIVRELEGRKRDPVAWRVVAEPIDKARRALERAHGARTSGDAAHGQLLERLALEWAQTAQALERAAAAEKDAAAKAAKAREAAVKTERARALLEETQARRGRVAAELAKAEVEAAEASKGAAAAEGERTTAPKKAKKPDGAKRNADRGAAPAPKPEPKPRPEPKQEKK